MTIYFTDEDISELVIVPIYNAFEPYRNGSVVIERSMFYGRDKEIDSIIQQIGDGHGNVLRGRCLALYGQTRTGKSSLLYHLNNRLRESPGRSQRRGIRGSI